MPLDPSSAQPKILLAIDNTPLRALLARVLERCGFHAVTADSADAAGAALNEIDMVVSHLADPEQAQLAGELERQAIKHFALQHGIPVDLERLLNFIKQQN